jgi:hypothetical protein
LVFAARAAAGGLGAGALPLPFCACACQSGCKLQPGERTFLEEPRKTTSFESLSSVLEIETTLRFRPGTAGESSLGRELPSSSSSLDRKCDISFRRPGWRQRCRKRKTLRRSAASAAQGWLTRAVASVRCEPPGDAHCFSFTKSRRASKLTSHHSGGATRPHSVASGYEREATWSRRQSLVASIFERGAGRVLRETALSCLRSYRACGGCWRLLSNVTKRDARAMKGEI